MAIETATDRAKNSSTPEAKNNKRTRQQPAEKDFDNNAQNSPPKLSL